MTPSDLEQMIRDIVRSELARQPQGATVHLAKISSGYASGNPALQLPGEAAAGTKTDRIVKPYDGVTSFPAASDQVIFGRDTNGKRVVTAKIATTFESDYWVEPGNTAAVDNFDNPIVANTERSTTSGTFTTLKSFRVFRPGRYRVTYEAARDGGTASYQLVAVMPDGSEIVVSATNSLSATTHPTYTAQTLDMTVVVQRYATINLQVKNDSAQTSYVQNAALKYQKATTMPQLHNAVLVD
jgi:hypothetical protein